MLDYILIVILGIIVIPLVVLVLGFASWLFVYVISEGFVMWAKFFVDVVEFLKGLWK